MSVTVAVFLEWIGFDDRSICLTEKDDDDSESSSNRPRAMAAVGSAWLEGEILIDENEAEIGF